MYSCLEKSSWHSFKTPDVIAKQSCSNYCRRTTQNSCWVPECWPQYHASKKLYLHTVDLFMYKFSNSMLPDMSVDMFTHVNTIHDLNTRHSAKNHLYVPLYATSCSQTCISYTRPNTRNFILWKSNPHAPICSLKNILRALFSECSLSDILFWCCVTMWCPYVFVPLYLYTCNWINDYCFA